MKIIRVINSLDFGGIEKVFEVTARYFPGAKEDLVFVAIGFGGAAEKYIKGLGYKVIVLNQSTRIPNFKLILTLVKIFKREKSEVVHCTGAEGNFHGLLAAWIASVDVRIGEEIGMPSHSALAKKIFRFTYSTASSVIAVAESVRQYLISTKEVSAEKAHLLYNPVDTEHYESSSSRHEADPAFFTILTVCRLHPIKNLDRLIDAVALLQGRFPNIRLWIVGDGAIRAQLEQHVVTAKIREQVTFFGFQTDPKPYFLKADLFVLPSLSEGHPVSLIEAMMVGLPAIATQVGGASEIIEEGKSGWLLDPHQTDDICNKIANVIILGEDNRRKVSDYARLYVTQHFSPASYYNSLMALYNRYWHED